MVFRWGGTEGTEEYFLKGPQEVAVEDKDAKLSTRGGLEERESNVPRADGNENQWSPYRRSRAMAARTYQLYIGAIFNFGGGH